MVATGQLPIPQITARRFGARCLPALTDDALYERTGVRVAFTGRAGGVSEGPYSSLNLGNHVGDDPASVERNRALVLEALDAADVPLVVPSQVHGEVVVELDDASPEALDADCVPVIVVSPTGRFAVAHAGWRGVENGVAAKAVRALARADAAELGEDAASGYNVYVGPHIHASCFETGADVRKRFEDRFGSSCIPDERHVDLLEALTVGLEEAGIDRARVADAGVCTVCSCDEFFSYRAAGGICGRHGAVVSGMGFKERYERTVAEAAACCEACGRDPKSVVVVAVSKTVGADEVAEAIEAGAHDFGENRPDSLEGKRARFPQQTWHFIGNIQSRRIPDIVRDAALVHSLYQQRHVPKFDAAAAASGKVQDVLLEVNVSGEASKSGLAPSEVAGMLEYCAGFPHVRVRGLMTMAPQGDAQRARACFADLARLRDKVRLGLDGEQAAVFDELSMGMSEDWHEAIAEGATIVRIGRALFDDAFEGPAHA